MKNGGRLRRNWLKGTLGDALHAVLCGAGHNLRMILRKLRLLCGWMQARSLGGGYPEKREKPTLPPSPKSLGWGSFRTDELVCRHPATLSLAMPSIVPAKLCAKRCFWIALCCVLLAIVCT
jgi:hypothetical protein